MKNPFSRFNTSPIIIASVLAVFVILPQDAFSQEEKLPRLVIEDLDEEFIWYFDYSESTNELMTLTRQGVTVWNMDNGAIVARYSYDQIDSCISSISVSKSGRYMALNCGNNRMVVYDRDRDEIVFEYSIPPIPAPTSVFGWFTKQENLLVITYLSSVEVWDIEKNERLFEESLPRIGITQNVQFYSNGDLFLVNNTVFSLWIQKPLFQVDANPTYLVNQDKYLIGVRYSLGPSSDHGQVVRYDALSGEVVSEFEPFLAVGDKRIRVAPDGNYLIEGTFDNPLTALEPGPVEIVGIADRAPVRSITNAMRESFLVREMKFFHGGRTLAISSGPRLYIYDLSDLITDVATAQLHED